MLMESLIDRCEGKEGRKSRTNRRDEIMIEANYSTEILNDNITNGRVHQG